LLFQFEKIEKVDDSVKKIIVDLVDTLYSTTGVGLSAPQIGINKAICIIDPYRKGDSPKKNYKVLINPKLISSMPSLKLSWEGCKSTPDFFVKLHKSQQIKVSCIDESGKEIVGLFKNLAAEVVEHELNHLNGKLIVDANFKKQDENRFKKYFKNLNNIFTKISHFQKADLGIVDKKFDANGSGILIYKEEDQIRMYFADKGKLSGIMSRIDVFHPLRPLALYSQAMLSVILFNHDPKLVYMIGFGGGRISMILHHYFINLQIDNTEIDKNVVDFSEKYFGITQDERMKVYVEDGRKFLRKVNKKYDFIFVDVFTGSGVHPLLLSTIEFYKLCKKRMVEKGVVCIYLIDSDPYFKSKYNSFIRSFNNVYRFYIEGICVLYGFDYQTDKLTKIKLMKLAKHLDNQYGFRFPIEHIAGQIEAIKVNNVEELENLYKKYGVLTDKSKIDDTLDVFTSISRNDPCPCGSGKTVWSIQYINKLPAERRVIFVTPFLSECDRIVRGCSRKRFVQPSVRSGRGRKINDFLMLVQANKNIATTIANPIHKVSIRI